MATKKKNKKKPAPKTAARKASIKKASAKKPAKGKKAAAKKSVVKKVAKKKGAPKRKPMSAAKAGAPRKGRAQEKVYPMPAVTESGRRSGLRSGDLQGLARPEGAASESVDELLEEGNTFEAGIVEGVERADDREERPVRTRQMPEDDVPREYLDED